MFRTTYMGARMSSPEAHGNPYSPENLFKNTAEESKLTAVRTHAETLQKAASGDGYSWEQLSSQVLEAFGLAFDQLKDEMRTAILELAPPNKQSERTGPP